MKKNNSLLKAIKGYLLMSTIYTGIKFLQCRGLGKENDKLLISNAIERMTGFGIEADSIVTIDDTDLHVSYNPYFQLLTNSLGGVAAMIPGTTEVFTDAQFRRMSLSTQMAILAHELGHFKCQHKVDLLYSIKRPMAIMRGRVLKVELEADEYACNIVGSQIMISALEEMKKIPGISKKELNLRIRYIKNNN
jgi:hypothetical protein